MTLTEPLQAFAGLDPAGVAELVAQTSDIAVVIDDGIVSSVSVNVDDLVSEGFPERWVGHAWTDCVTEESRPKIEELLIAAAADVPSSRPWRQVNHPTRSGLDLPVSYATVGIPSSGCVIAVGREQRTISTLQQRLIEAHQTVERDYARLRSAEVRYASLFRAIGTPVLIFEKDAKRVADANPAAAELLGFDLEKIASTTVADCFDADSVDGFREAAQEAAERRAVRHLEVATRTGVLCSLSVSLFRDREREKLVVSFLAARSEDGDDPVASGVVEARSRLSSLVQALPDGLVLVGSDLRVLAANRAFRDLLGLGAGDADQGIWLPDHVGRSTTELTVLISNLRSQGTIRNFATVVRDLHGQEEEIELSAVISDALPGRVGPAYGFAIRSVARRIRAEPALDEALPRSVDQLTGLVGRMPLKQIVQETTDFIERLCIEAALEVTRDNRASAAEMLGLSRQALYTKLKRFGFDR